MRTHVFPGQEIVNQCTYTYQGIVLTTNNTGCRAIWDPTANMSVPAGWTRATWVTDMLLVETDGICGTNYESWYAGYPSNQRFGDPDYKPYPAPDNWEAIGDEMWPPALTWYAWFSANLMGFLFNCAWANGTRAYYRPMETKSDGTPIQALLIYLAVFHREQGGLIQWPTTGGFIETPIDGDKYNELFATRMVPVSPEESPRMTIQPRNAFVPPGTYVTNLRNESLTSSVPWRNVTRTAAIVQDAQTPRGNSTSLSNSVC